MVSSNVLIHINLAPSLYYNNLIQALHICLKRIKIPFEVNPFYLLPMPYLSICRNRELLCNRAFRFNQFNKFLITAP